MKHYHLYFFLLIFLASCTIQEEIHFNKDYSGKFAYKIDMSGLKTFAEMMKKTGDSATANSPDMSFDMLESLKDSMKTEGLNKIEGISNFKTDYDKSGLITFSFDFKDMDALNRVYQRLSSPDQMSSMMSGTKDPFTPGPPPGEDEKKTKTKTSATPFTYFSRKGNQIVYRRPRAKLDNEEMKKSMQELDMFKGMGDVLTFEVIMTFDKKIKKVSAKNIEVNNKDEAVKMKFSLDDLSSKEPEPEVIIRLK